MNEQCFLQRGRSLLAGALIIAVAVGCASRPEESAAPRSEPLSQPAAQAGSDSSLEEILVTGNRAKDRLFEQRQSAQPEQSVEEPSASTASAAPQSLDELLRTVEQGRSSFDEAQQRLSAYAKTAGPGAAGTLRVAVDSPLGRAAPGDEIWIIARSSDTDHGRLARDDETPGSGAMLASVVGRSGEPEARRESVPLPLEHTDVHAVVSGYVGTVDVIQEFANPFDEKIEAIYLFPLPEKAAVSEFVMTIGDRRIRGILREREQAEEIYREARAQGYQASLLTQQRPNIFEQKVANIEPGKQIDVNIRYFHTLAYHDGWYSFIFPTVVGPRYNPPGSVDPVLAVPRTQLQPTNDTVVRYLRPNERSGHDISIEVDLDAGVSIEQITASHAVHETRTGPGSARIELADRATMTNEDFVLNFKVAGDMIKSNLLTYVDPDSEQGYFTLMVYPPGELEALDRQPLELVFVLDCSGSMQGEPLAQAKDAVLAALDRLEPDDTFQIIRFSTDASQLGSTPVPATPENLRRARQYVRELHGGGGTQMIEGIKAALDFPHDQERFRFVTFLTDGYIGNEAEILGAIYDRLGESRIFSFGVGSSVNRYLLERMAGIGRGAVAYLSLQDSGREVMDLFFDRISHPALIDVDVDWGNMRVADLYPSKLPDLFVGRPIIVTGKYSGQARPPTISGRAAGKRISFSLPRNASATTHEFIPNLWARLRIADLADKRAYVYDPSDELGREIKSTALKYGLMSDYTAFVAVDASRITEGDHGTTVFQAVPVPEGVRYDTTVGLSEP